jgi:hypothetical protein
VKGVSPVITYGVFLVPVAMLPAVPLEAVADPTAKVVPPWLMLILAKLLLLGPPPVPVEKAEMLQDPDGHRPVSGYCEFVIVPVARK